MAETIVELLQAGRNRLMQDGWRQRTLVDVTGRRCALGALMDAKLETSSSPYVFARSVYTLTDQEYRAIEFLAEASRHFHYFNPNLAYNESNIIRVTELNDEGTFKTFYRVRRGHSRSERG